MQIDHLLVRPVVAAALAEDLGWGDVTTDNIIAPGQTGEANLVAREEGVLAGIEAGALVFATVDPALKVEVLVADGRPLVAGTVLARVRGSLGAILRAERVALNFVQRLSGIASLTALYVAAVAGTGARIVDTRKTTPNLRLLEKYAVRLGGGRNHRFCLSDAVLIKDNHLVAMRACGQSLSDAVGTIRRQVPHTVKVEVEAETLADVEEALRAGADAILLDNMGLGDLGRAVALIDGRAITEASGGISLTTVRAVAECGVELISVGALTHSAKALDVSLELGAL